MEGSTLTISIWHFRLFKAVLMHFLKELGKTCPPGWNKFPTFSRTSDWVTPHFHYSLKEARTDISLLGLGWNTWERQCCSSLENLVDCPTQLTLVTWICQLSRRWDPSKGGSKMFGASLRPGKDIWRRFLCKIYMVCPYKLVTCKQNASKKVQNLLKTAVSAARQSHPQNEEQACSKPLMDFSGSDLHISH